MSAGNGHAPQVTDLGAVLERTRPTRILRLPIAAIRTDSLTVYELAAVGRASGLAPAELVPALGDKTAWPALELAQAIAWVIARREEPGLTWDEAQTFGLDLVPADAGPPDPTPAGAKRSRRRGTPTPSGSVE